MDVSVTADWTDIDPSLVPCLQETESQRKHDDLETPGDCKNDWKSDRNREVTACLL